jgi:entericidin A
MKKLLAAIIAGSFLLTACNTMEGFGRDVEKTGDKIENSAQKHK